MAQRPAGKSEPPKKPLPKKPAAPKKAAGSAVPAKRPAAKKPARRAPPAKAHDGQTLTPKQQRFVEEYLVDLNGAQAAVRAGYSVHTAKQIATENLAKPYLQAAIAEARKQQQERTQITADRVVKELGLIAFADPRELVEVKTGCCRHCYGEGNRYQRTVGEMNADRELWAVKGNAPADFDELGGIGFDPLKLPHPECPECGGDGQARVVPKDTRHLSPQALALYAGAKMGKYGVEVMLHSKMEAVEKLNKFLGVYEKDNQQKSDPLAALLHRISKENGNGFSPIADDPERTGPRAGSTLQVKQDPTDEED